MFLYNEESFKQTVKENKGISRIHCGVYRRDEDIFTDNLIWQVLEIPRGFVRLLNAYLDGRNNKTIVRINASGIRLDFDKDKIFCQFWSENSTAEPYVVQASEYLLMWDKYWKKIDELKGPQNYPYLITCSFDKTNNNPVSVSLTSKPCGVAENKLRIIDNQPVDRVKKNFGVCMSHITFESRDFGMRFIELIHVLKILGADKIHIYNRYVHPEVFEVMKYFEDRGFIEVYPFIEPQTITMGTTGTLQMNVLNDCFYRIRHLYKYIVVQDTDEVIMPSNSEDKNWNDLMTRILEHFKGSTFDSFPVANFYFPQNAKIEENKNVPEYFYMLQHIQRSIKPQPPGKSEKSFNIPDRIITLIAHYSLFCLNGSRCRRTRVPENIAQLNHYRDFVTGELLGKTVNDWKLWKFKDELVKAVNETLSATKFKP